jgi:uncharacterized membrane protein YraQ (UPF0718 family)
LPRWLVLAKLLPVLMAVIVLLGLFNSFFNPKKIAKFLGSESGLRGWLIAAFIYVRAIKLPWIPLMVEYFGWPFTIIISLYLIIAGVVQGMLIDLFER